MTNSMHKNLRYFSYFQLIFSKEIIGQRIPQSDKPRGTPGHMSPKVVVSDATFP